jgi:hypothetical protein
VCIACRNGETKVRRTHTTLEGKCSECVGDSDCCYQGVNILQGTWSGHRARSPMATLPYALDHPNHRR